MEEAAATSAWDFLRFACAPESRDEDDARVARLLTQPIDWPAVLDLAEKHGVASLLHQKLSGLAGAPPQVMSVLARGYDTDVRKSLFLARELFQVSDCLELSGIETLPYKGIVLSEVFYGDMALRRPGDLDLLVRGRDALRAKNAVREVGYRARVAIPEAAEPDYVASGYEYTFDSSTGKNVLELKWALVPGYFAIDFDVEGLFERAVGVEVGGRAVKTLSPDDLMLVLSVHAAKHVWGRLIWLCDIAQVLRRAQLNWNVIRVQAERLGIQRMLHVTLLLTQQLLGVAIPAEIADAVASDRSAQGLAEEIARAVAAGTTYEEQQISYFRLMMRLRERRGDRLRFLSRLAFTPGPGEWETIRLPRPLFPVYRLVRLARLAAKLAGN